MNLFNFVYLKFKNKKSRFFSSNSKNINGLTNLLEVDYNILSPYSHNYFDFRNCIERINFIIVHNKNFYINVSVWHRTESDVLSILNSDGFKKILLSHEQKFGTQLFGWYEWDYNNAILWVHPLLCLYFIPKENRQLRFKIFGSLLDPTYEQLCQLFSADFLGEHLKVAQIKSHINRNKIYEFPKMEYYLIKILKHRLQEDSWNTFQIQNAFYAFHAGPNTGPYAFRPILYIGITNGQSDLKNRLNVVTKYYQNVKLLSVVKFYNNFDGQLHKFRGNMIEKLNKIGQPFRNPFPSTLNLHVLRNISVGDFEHAVFLEYIENFQHTSSLCLPEYIECFNNSSAPKKVNWRV